MPSRAMPCRAMLVFDIDMSTWLRLFFSAAMHTNSFNNGAHPSHNRGRHCFNLAAASHLDCFYVC